MPVPPLPAVNGVCGAVPDASGAPGTPVGSGVGFGTLLGAAGVAGLFYAILR